MVCHLTETTPCTASTAPRRRSRGGVALLVAGGAQWSALPGRLVADATVSAVHHVLEPAPQLSVTCELLLLEDG